MHRLIRCFTFALLLLCVACAQPSLRWESRVDGRTPTVADSDDCRHQARRQAELRFPQEPSDSPRRHAPSPSDVVADSDRLAAENAFFTQCMRQKGFELVDCPLRS